MSAHSHAIAALDGALANTTSAQAQLLEDYFSRAQTIDLLTANNPAFRDFYRLPGSRAAKVRSGGPVLDKVNRALGYLERLFPTSIGEACFIDRDGPENARMVRGARATPKGPVPRRIGRLLLRADVRPAAWAGLLPQESQDVSEAMRLVDQRMYAQKTSGRRSTDRQTRDVLLRALQERNPELAERHAAGGRAPRRRQDGHSRAGPPQARPAGRR